MVTVKMFATGCMYQTIVRPQDLVQHEDVSGEVYNVGGHNERTNLEVVKTIIRTLAKSEELIEFVPDRLGHDKRYAIDATKLEKLGWKPTYTFETGIAQTIQWYLDNKWWWEQIISRQYREYFIPVRILM